MITFWSKEAEFSHLCLLLAFGPHPGAGTFTSCSFTAGIGKEKSPLFFISPFGLGHLAFGSRPAASEAMMDVHLDTPLPP